MTIFRKRGILETVWAMVTTVTPLSHLDLHRQPGWENMAADCAVLNHPGDVARVLPRTGRT